MRDRKKRNTIIGVLCCLLVFMGIGYAILSQTLTINGIGNVKGNWKVEITNIELKSQTGRATEVSSSYTSTTASFEADLYMPGDSIEYEVTVTNNGNIDAVLQSITPTTTNKVADIKFSHSEIDNTPLTAGKTITFTMKVEFLESATAIPDVERTGYKLELNYIQYDGVSAYTPAVETTEESCFKVTDDGVLMGYNYSCGEDVVVPATVNGVAIKEIGSFAFLNPIQLLYSKDGEEQYIVFYDQESYEEASLLFSENGENIEESFGGNIYIMGDAALDSLDLATLRSKLDSSRKYKVYEEDSELKLEETDLDPNVFFVIVGNTYTRYYCICDTEDTCNMLKQYYRNQDPAKKVGVTDETYYEYIYNAPYSPIQKYYSLTDSELDEYIYETPSLVETLTIKSIDLSHAVYIENLNYMSLFGAEDKVIMPPNIEFMINAVTTAKEIIFPANTKLKVIGSKAFVGGSLTSIEIPASVVSIGYEAFGGNQLININFESNSKLIAIYGNDVYGEGHSGAFSGNQLQTVKLPPSLEYMGSRAFYDNESLTQIVLTSPTDINGWPNGGTVNVGRLSSPVYATIVYER